jgi:predicted CopG family antitoxin
MTQQIRVSDETYASLVGLKGFMEMKDRVPLSMNDVINELLDHFPKQTLDLEENDIFKVNEPPKQN